MFNFAGITHIQQLTSRDRTPGYNFSFVGSVPIACMEPCKPTRSDIMGGRVQADGFAYHTRKMETIQQALDIAREGGAKLCTADGCACRELF